MTSRQGAGGRISNFQPPTSNLQLPTSNLQLPASNLISHIRRWGLRLRLVESLTWGVWGAAAGLGLGTGVALAARVWPLLTARWLAGLAGLLILAGTTIGLAGAWLRPRSLASSARFFDRRFGLAERLATAVEIGSGRLRVTPAMAEAQLADTLDVARRVIPGAMLPLWVSGRALAACGALVVAAALLLWLPNPQEDVLSRRAAVRAAVEEQIEELETAQEQVVAAEGLSEAEREALTRALEEAIAALDEGKASPEEAVAALAEAEQALVALQDPHAASRQAGLEQAAGEMADSELTRDISEALANGDYQQAARSLAAYTGTKGEVLTREEELELARELAQSASAFAASNPDLAQELARAADAIERGDIAEAREAIREAARRMGAAGEQVQGQKMLEETLAELQEGREQVAQAGGREGGGAGERGSGGKGQMAQQGGQPGGGQPGGQASGQPGGQQAGGGQQTQPGHSEDAGTGRPYDEVYVPYRLNEEGQGVDVGREGGEGLPGGDTSLPAPGVGQASVPYREVYADYAAQAGAALEGSYIPLGLKGYVRDYFSSLE